MVTVTVSMSVPSLIPWAVAVKEVPAVRAVMVMSPAPLPAAVTCEATTVLALMASTIASLTADRLPSVPRTLYSTSVPFTVTK